MENNIPTAEEMFDANPILSPGVTRQACIVFMKTFAKLHVKAALKNAAKEAYIEDFGSIQEGTTCIIDEDSILYAYPLTNIK